MAFFLVVLVSGCGGDDVPKSLDRQLLPRSELPKGLPKLKESVSNGSVSKFVDIVLFGDEAGQARGKRALKRAGFVRGSAQVYEDESNNAKVLILMQGVAEMRDDDAAAEIFEITRERGKRFKMETIDASISDNSISYKYKTGSIFSYGFIWQQNDLVHFLALVPNPNGGPKERDVVALAEKAAKR